MASLFFCSFSRSLSYFAWLHASRNSLNLQKGIFEQDNHQKPQVFILFCSLPKHVVFVRQQKTVFISSLSSLFVFSLSLILLILVCLSASLLSEKRQKTSKRIRGQWRADDGRWVKKTLEEEEATSLPDVECMMGFFVCVYCFFYWLS